MNSYISTAPHRDGDVGEHVNLAGAAIVPTGYTSVDGEPQRDVQGQYESNDRQPRKAA